jgi:hypothetical protein|tara:strand:+ start:2566 stop:2874 length:309 start_codon:yes stop_codon:yes gene_type:complete
LWIDIRNTSLNSEGYNSRLNKFDEGISSHFGALYDVDKNANWYLVVYIYEEYPDIVSVKTFEREYWSTPINTKNLYEKKITEQNFIWNINVEIDERRKSKKN